jgi:hypothetical protein
MLLVVHGCFNQISHRQLSQITHPLNLVAFCHLAVKVQHIQGLYMANLYPGAETFVTPVQTPKAIYARPQLTLNRAK